MALSGQHDRNKLSFVGDQGGATYRADQFSDQLNAEGVLDGRGYDDALKLSNASNVTFDSWPILGGDEDCVDVNRGSSIRVDGQFWPRGSRVATIKGGAKDVALSGVIHGRAKKFDVVIGQWSDQSNAETGVVYLNLRHDDGSPVTVDIWKGAGVNTTLGGPYQVTVRPRLLVMAWFTVRWVLGKLFG